MKARSRKFQSSDPAPEMSVGGAIEAFPDEWILMDITRNEAKDNLASLGKILDHNLDRKKVVETELKLSRQWVAGGTRREHFLYLFDGVRPLSTGAEVRAAMAQLWEKGFDERTWRR